MAATPIYVLSIALCLSSGFHQGYVASVLNQPYLVIEDYINASWIERTGAPISPNQLNFMWSGLNVAFPLATIIGQLLAAWMCDKFGRKKTAIIASSLYIPGCLLSYSARRLFPAFELLFIGRLIWSMANGINTVNATVWIVECAPSKHRGRMAAMQEVFMAIGSLMTQAVGVPFSTADTWENNFVPPLIISVLTIVMFCFTYESPQYLIQNKKDYVLAREALGAYYGKRRSSLIDAEIRICRESGSPVNTLSTTSSNASEDTKPIIKKPKKPMEEPKPNNDGYSSLTIMFNPCKANDPTSIVVRHAAWLGLMVKIAYVFTGARCLRAYSTFMLHTMSHWSMDHALYGSFVIGLLRLPVTFVPVLIVDRLGRRPLMLSSMVVSFFSLILIMTSWGTLIGIGSLLLINACGIGSVSRFYAAELVPRHLLLKSVSILTMWEAMMKITFEFAFYPLANTVGAPALLIFIIPTAFCLFLIWHFCPETSKRTVNEVLNTIAQRRNVKVSFQV